jgi:hypothetical protein
MKGARAIRLLALWLAGLANKGSLSMHQSEVKKAFSTYTLSKRQTAI